MQRGGAGGCAGRLAAAGRNVRRTERKGAARAGGRPWRRAAHLEPAHARPPGEAAARHARRCAGAGASRRRCRPVRRRRRRSCAAAAAGGTEQPRGRSGDDGAGGEEFDVGDYAQEIFADPLQLACPNPAEVAASSACLRYAKWTARRLSPAGDSDFRAPQRSLSPPKCLAQRGPAVARQLREKVGEAYVEGEKLDGRASEERSGRCGACSQSDEHSLPLIGPGDRRTESATLAATSAPWWGGGVGDGETAGGGETAGAQRGGGGKPEQRSSRAGDGRAESAAAGVGAEARQR